MIRWEQDRYGPGETLRVAPGIWCSVTTPWTKDSRKTEARIMSLKPRAFDTRAEAKEWAVRQLKGLLVQANNRLDEMMLAPNPSEPAPGSSPAPAQGAGGGGTEGKGT